METKRHINIDQEKNMGVAGLIISILGLLCSCCAGLLAIPIIVIGITLSAYSFLEIRKKTDTQDPVSLSGLIIGIIAVVLIVFGYFLAFSIIGLGFLVG